jgi:trk system potassium uptake protein TrkA
VVNDAEHADFFRKLGANVMENPEDVVAHHLYNAVKRSNVQDFAMLTQGSQIFQLRISESSPLVNRSVEEAVEREILPESVRIVAIERDGEATTALDDLTILSEDVLTLFALERVSDELVEKLSG